MSVNLKCIVCTEIHAEMEGWSAPFLASERYVLIQTINSAHFFIVFFDALKLLNIDSTFLLVDVPFFVLFCLFFFAVEFSPYFYDATVTTLLSFHLTKAILALSWIRTSADPLSSFFISFIGFNGVFSTLFNQTVTVAAIPFSLKERCN